MRPAVAIADHCSSISFKRKQKRPARFSLSGLFSVDTAGSLSGRARSGSQVAGDRPMERQSHLTAYGNSNGDLDGSKDGAPLDWYVEGPGRRVGYDDLTAIDWIFEYTKERQRKRLLYATGQGFLGHVRQLLDASHVWLVLIATGVAVGVLAASIDIVSNWLGDIKTGYCKNGRGGGKFYLNKSFCCWGHEGNIPIHNAAPHFFLTLMISFILDMSECLDWTPWRNALGVASKAGGYIVEYIFFVLYSVGYLSPP